MRTTDGVKLTNLLRIAGELGIEVREGSRHPYILRAQNMRPCPLAGSTHAERMVAPWLAQATGLQKRELYQAMRKGYLEG